MASRRVVKSAVEWAKIAERVPARQKEAYRALKTSSDHYVNRVADLPEALPKIDFTEYKNRLTDKAVVQEFEKLYAALDVPYPTDSKDVKGRIQTELKTQMTGLNDFKKTKNERVESINKFLALIDSVPPPEEMTTQMFAHYYPAEAINPNRENPRLYPQYDDSLQIDQAYIYYNNKQDYRNLQFYEEGEEEVRLSLVEQKKLKEVEAAKQKEEAAQKAAQAAAGKSA